VNIPAVIAWFLLTLAMGAAQTAEAPWTAAGAKDGIALAHREDPDAGAREVRATVDLPFTSQHVFDVVCDQTQYAAIVPGLEEVRLLSGTVPDDYELYFRYAPRFAVVAARDVAVRVQRETGATGVGCRWSHLPDRVPPQRGAVRMRFLSGRWFIEPLASGGSRVVYQVTADPGGRIPGWLVRRGALATLPDVIERVKRRLLRESAGGAGARRGGLVGAGLQARPLLGGNSSCTPRPSAIRLTNAKYPMIAHAS
jgi:ribosome-associated toxin RatA of RatAB toxin-antitoxin module